MAKNSYYTPATVVMNTIISSSVSSISVFFLRPFIIRKLDPTFKYQVRALCSGLIVGLIAITGCGNLVTPWVALIIGIISGFLYCLSCRLYEKLKIDDPVESSQMHAISGLWGLLAVGLFDKEQGIIYTGTFSLMLKQLIGAGAIIIWSAVTSFIYFYSLKKVNKFRIG